MYKILLKVAFTIALLVLAACELQDPFEIPDNPLSGEIGGVEFEYSTGIAMASEGLTEIFIVDQAMVFCGMPLVNDFHVRFDFLTSGARSWSLEMGEYVSLYDPDEKWFNNCSDGYVEIREVTDTEISGGMHAFFDEQNRVSGTFTVPICFD